MLSAAYRLASTPENDRPYGRQRAPALRPVRGRQPLGASGRLHPWRLLAAGRPQGFFLRRARLNANGITVAIPSYSLAPAASVMEIIDEMKLCLVTLWKKLAGARW